MRKIACILETPIENHGGLNLLARELANGLASNCKSYVLCPEKLVDAPGVDLSDCKFTKLTWPGGCHHKERQESIESNLRDLKIEIVIFHGGDFSWGVGNGRISMVNKIARQGIPIIYVNHQSTPLFSSLPTLVRPSPWNAAKAGVRFLSSWFLKTVQLFSTSVEVTVSDFEFAQAKRRYHLNRGKFVRIYHSRMPSSLPPASNPGGKKKTILSVGHFAFRKGQHVLLEAFGMIASKHPAWRLQFIGSSSKGEYHDYLEGLIKQYDIGNQVDMVTETQFPDEFFQQASIYVQPSLEEAYGLALQEAMYFGCACIGANAGGIRDSITNPRYLFPSGDPLPLSEILDQLLRDDPTIKHLQSEARSSYLKLNRNSEQMMREYVSLIDRLLLEA